MIVHPDGRRLGLGTFAHEHGTEGRQESGEKRLVDAWYGAPRVTVPNRSIEGWFQRVRWFIPDFRLDPAGAGEACDDLML